MSALIVSDQHITTIVDAALWYNVRKAGAICWRDRKLNEINAQDVVDALLAVNHEAVHALYHGIRDLPLPYTIAYQYPDIYRMAPNAVATLKLIQSFEYQSVSAPNWKDHPVKLFLDHLTQALITMLPGYDDQPWTI